MHFILSEQGRPNRIELDLIRQFYDKHLTAAAHFRFECKTLKSHFDGTLHYFFFNSKLEQLRQVVMNNR